MKTLFPKITLFLVAGLIGFSAEAQLLNKIKKAAEQGATNAVEKKTAERVEKAVESKLEGLERLMFGLGEPAPTEPQYSFTGFLTMEMVSKDKKGKAQEPIFFKSLLSGITAYTGMQFLDPNNPQVATVMIMDISNEASVILLDDGKQKSSMAFKVDYSDIQKEADDHHLTQLEDGEYTLRKTGNTKTILGYTCEAYEVKNEDGEGIYWITEEPIQGYATFMGHSNPLVSANTMERYSDFFKNAPKGSFMEMTYSSKDGSNMQINVIEINTDSPQLFTMTDYPGITAGTK